LSEPKPLRVAIVGCGPKGLYALERLTAHARGSDESPPLSVDVYEPHPSPGAGPVYDPGQPEYLRMNFAADLVDMWPTREHDRGRPAFSEWRSGIDGASDEAYPPRALVGRYLAEGFRNIAAGARRGVTVRHLPERVSGVGRAGNGWMIEAEEERQYDEVLIATGHEGYAIFPVERDLSPQKVPPGSTVTIRGFALTMIDASLALTEGRGGTFRTGREPYLLRYDSGPAEVARIYPWSRTGRPMLAKPDPTKAVISPDLERIALEGSAELAAMPSGSPISTGAAIVANVAVRSLRTFDSSNEATESVERRIADALAGRAAPCDVAPAEEIERSIQVGVGQGEPGPDWALGHAWRSIYPALVERLGARGLADVDWPAFRRLASEMERISFGPPPVNAAKLLALIECGKVDLSHLTDGPQPGADVSLDGVIPPPGALSADDSLIGRLVRDGHARVPPGRRGVELSADVTCIGADGRPSDGLGAIGRPTEDWVIGNDTLNRSLHPHPDLWAQRIIGRAVAR
jgi:uncharacterized NAD(P)/FAD-binding protein YdhS